MAILSMMDWLLDIGAEVDVIDDHVDCALSPSFGSSGHQENVNKKILSPKMSPVRHHVPCPSDFLEIDLQEFDPMLTLQFDHQTNEKLAPSDSTNQGQVTSLRKHGEESTTPNLTRSFPISCNKNKKVYPAVTVNNPVQQKFDPLVDPVTVPQVKVQAQPKNLVHPPNCLCNTVVTMASKNCFECFENPPNFFTCSICHRSYQNQADLTRHLQLHIVGPPPSSATYSSNYCPMYFIDPINTNRCVPSSWICGQFDCRSYSKYPPNFGSSSNHKKIQCPPEVNNLAKIQNQPATTRPPRPQRPIKLTIDPELLKKEVVFRCQICGAECRDWTEATRHARAEH